MRQCENFNENNKGDRFIPRRRNQTGNDYKVLAEVKENGSRLQYATLLGDKDENLLCFNTKKVRKEQEAIFKEKIMRKDKPTSKLIKNGEKQILDIPGFKNDYYLNLLDAYNENLIATVLYSSVFVFNRKTKKINLCSSLEQDEVQPTCVKFNTGGSDILAVGSDEGSLYLLDFINNKRLIGTQIHQARIGCIDWNSRSETILATGSKDKTISLYDTRTAKVNNVQNYYHFGEICGLKWNPNGIELATGGNDNLINIWDLRNLQKPKQTITDHTAAVRALDWCPWDSNILASGGGSGDMRLMIHDTHKNQCLKNIHTSSQVCALVWEPESQKLLTAHGFSKYQLCLWDIETESLLYEFIGHKNRILSLAKARENSTVFSASADETLRVWNMRAYTKRYVDLESELSPMNLR